MKDFEKTARRIAELVSKGNSSRDEPPTIVEVSASPRTYAFDVATNLDRCRLARLDEREEVLDAAMLEAEERNIPLLTIPALATALQLKDGSVDAMISCDSWSRLSGPKTERRLAEMLRCLRPGGMVFVIECDGDHSSTKPSPALRRLERSLKKAGFELLSFEASNEFGSVAARKPS